MRKVLMDTKFFLLFYMIWREGMEVKPHASDVFAEHISVLQPRIKSPILSTGTAGFYLTEFGDLHLLKLFTFSLVEQLWTSSVDIFHQATILTLLKVH